MKINSRKPNVLRLLEHLRKSPRRHVASARELLIVIITGQDPKFLTRPGPKRILKVSEFSSEFPTEKWYLEIQTKFRYASAPRETVR